MVLHKNQAAYDQVCTARMVMNGKLPYMRPTTMGLIPIEHPGLGTVAVTERMQFLYDPEFMLKLTDPLVQAGVMFHEVLHVLKNHAARGRALGIDEHAPQWMRTLWNYAGDMENNRDVDAAGLKLPDFMTPIRIANFKDTKGQPFPQNGTAEEFYRLLCEVRAQEQANQQKQKDDQQKEKDEGSDDAGDDQPEQGDDSDDGDGSESGDDDGEPGDESGDDGAGDDGNAPGDGEGEGEGEGADAGNAPGKGAGQGVGKGSDAPGQGSDDAGEGEGEGTGQGSGNGRTPAPKARVAGGACGSCAANKVDGEDAHVTDPGKAESEVQAARSLTKAAIQEHVSRMGRGSVPGGLAVWAEKPDAPLPVPFWKLIRTTVTRSLTWAQGKANLRFNRPSRKQAGLGYGQGRAVMPALASPVPRLWIGVDSSASMGTADVSIVLSIVDLATRNTNAKFTFFSCDAKIHAMQKVARWQDAVKLIQGGGGTDFNPVFDAAQNALPHERPDVIIFVTDGCPNVPPPAHCPPNMKVVWLLVGAYAQSPCDWGDQIFVGDNVQMPV